MTRAVVFAYHNVGVRCLSVLLAHGVEVPLVITHLDNPNETIWFESVRELGLLHELPTVTPADPNAPEVMARIAAAQPDLLFSFYYRHMLRPELLAFATRGALNMHGSLLPKYRGRVPVNWAVIKGESETGATLHYMVQKPDAGDIVDQQAVPILPDDTAFDVFNKVTVAAEMTLHRSLTALIAGTAPRQPQDLAQGSYFGGRRPADGRIDWRESAAAIHNLVRGVAPPYPGAFANIEGRMARILKTRLVAAPAGSAHTLHAAGGRLQAVCGDGRSLELVRAELDGLPLTPERFARVFGTAPVRLD